jgi:hypothetical protein
VQSRCPQLTRTEAALTFLLWESWAPWTLPSLFINHIQALAVCHAPLNPAKGEVASCIVADAETQSWVSPEGDRAAGRVSCGAARMRDESGAMPFHRVVREDRNIGYGRGGVGAPVGLWEAASAPADAPSGFCARAFSSVVNLCCTPESSRFVSCSCLRTFSIAV